MKNLISKSMILAMLIAISVQYSTAQDTTKAVQSVEQSATKPVKAKKAKTKAAKNIKVQEVEDLYEKMQKNNAKISELVKEKYFQPHFQLKMAKKSKLKIRSRVILFLLNLKVQVML